MRSVHHLDPATYDFLYLAADTPNKQDLVVIVTALANKKIYIKRKETFSL
jgi:hypothetical protein